MCGDDASSKLTPLNKITNQNYTKEILYTSQLSTGFSKCFTLKKRYQYCIWI